MTRPATPARRIAAVVIAAALLGTAACSSNSSDDGAADVATTTTAAADMTKQGFIDGFVTEISSSGVVTAAQGKCIATAWTDLIGFEALVDSGMTPQQFGAIDPASFRKLELTGAEGEALFDLLKPCGFDLVEGLRTPVSPEATDGEQACIDAAVTPERVRAAFVAGINEEGGESQLGEITAEANACQGAKAPSGDKQDYIDAVVEVLGTDGAIPADKGECIASAWIDIIGFDAIVAAAITPEQFGNVDNASVAKLGISSDAAKKIYDSFDGCGVDFPAVFRARITPPDATPEQKACITDVLKVDVMWKAFVASFTEKGGNSKFDVVFEDTARCLAE